MIIREIMPEPPVLAVALLVSNLAKSIMTSHKGRSDSDK